MKIAILDDWFDTIRTLPCFLTLENFDVTIFNDYQPDVTKLVERLQPFEIIVLFRERTAIRQALLEQLPHLKLISQRSVYPHIDVNACTKNGILLCSNMHAGSPSYAAAEHTWALILAAMRQIPQQMANMAKGNWQIGVGKTLQGRTLGLYGYGRIARTVETYAQAFGMNVIWWGSNEGRERALADGKTIPSSRADFFSTSDVVSIHVRLKPTTKAIITMRDFASMREDALFVNTSRSGLIEEGALMTALNSDHPITAALDVFDEEPITWANDPLATHPRVIATPHIGFLTEDELEIQFSDIFDQIVAYTQRKPINMINAEVWNAQTSQQSAHIK